MVEKGGWALGAALGFAAAASVMMNCSVVVREMTVESDFVVNRVVSIYTTMRRAFSDVHGTGEGVRRRGRVRFCGRVCAWT